MSNRADPIESDSTGPKQILLAWLAPSISPHSRAVM